MEKQEIIHIIKQMRIKMDQISKELNRIVIITTVFESIDKHLIEVNPFRFNLNTGECFAKNVVTGKLDFYKFW